MRDGAGLRFQLRAWVISGLAICICFNIDAQGVKIGTMGDAPDPSAILDIGGHEKGVLLPRLTQTQRDLISAPAPGLMIYQTDAVPGLYIYIGSAWQLLASSSNVWSTAGNGGTDPMTSFIGTTDNMPLRFRVDNRWAGGIDISSRNITLGDSAGVNLGFASDNIAIGSKALKSPGVGITNIAIGTGALKQNTFSQNIAIGHAALQQNNFGGTNIALGHNSLFNNVGGNANISIGFSSMLTNQYGSNNLAIGNHSLSNNTTGARNMAIGQDALQENSIGYDNLAIGYESMYSVDIGYENLAIGKWAMYYNQEGEGNTAIGFRALENSVDDDNTVIGYEAGFGITSGDKNVAIGTSALYTGGVGTMNVAVGNLAMQSTYGSYNTAIGSWSLRSTTSGHHNVSIGSKAMVNNTSGEYNVALGDEALYNNQDGDYHIAIGPYSGTSSTTPNLYNTIGIGNNGTLHTVSNQVVIGNSAITHNGGFQPWEVYSDARMKFDVRENVVGLDFIKRLRPVTYFRNVDLPAQITGNHPLSDFPDKYDVESIRLTGFLAQEVEAAAMACGYDFSGINKPSNDRSLYALSYESFVVPLVKAVQEQQLIIQSQESRIENLETRLAVLEKLMMNSR